MLFADSNMNKFFSGCFYTVGTFVRSKVAMDTAV